MVTKLEPGEDAWSAVKDMMRKNSKGQLESNKSDLQSIIPAVGPTAGD